MPEFEVSNFPGARWLLPLNIVLLALAIIASVILDGNYTYLASLPVLLPVLYYLTIGRKRYLQLKQVR